MKTVYVATGGDYSSYTIYGVFSSMEKAEAYLRLYPHADDIEPWEVDEIELTGKRQTWYVVMDRKGRTFRVDKTEPGEVVHRWWDPSPSSYEPRYTAPFLQSKVHADSKDHALKIVNELRTRVLALGKWGEPDLEVPAEEDPDGE